MRKTNFLLTVVFLGTFAWAGSAPHPQAATPAHKRSKPQSRAKAAPASAATDVAARKPFVGTWKLVLTTEQLPDGTVRPYGFGPHAAGYLMYDLSGHMCAQVVNMDRPKWKDPEHPKPEEVKTAFDGFGGYCGSYTVDAAKGTMAHLPEVALDPNLAGEAKPRSYRFEGDKLIYSGTEPFEGGGETHWTMVWQKVE